MSTPAVTHAVLERAKEYGPSGSSHSESQTTKVDVTISGAPDAAKGANGDYSLHLTPLKSEEIPYYQGIKGDSNQMYIIYSKERNRWEIASNMATESERKLGVVAYIACAEKDAAENYLASVSGKLEWHTTKQDGSDGTLANGMVAIVHSGGESSPAAAPAATSSPVAVSASPVAAPSVVVTAPTVTEMKKIINDIDNQYTTVSDEYKKLNKISPDTDWSNFKTNNLDKANTELKEALAQLDAFKKAGSGSSTSTATADPATSGLLSTEIIHDRDASPSGYDAVGGSSSSSAKSKKNRKSHKSYHPGIGKTRKHHSHSEPKRVSFVHQA